MAKVNKCHLQSNSNLPKWKRQPTMEWVSYHWKYVNYLGRGWVAICQRECKGEWHMGKLENKTNSAPFTSKTLLLVMKLESNKDQSLSHCPSLGSLPLQPLSALFWFNLITEDPAVPLLLPTLETCRDPGLWWQSLPGVRRREFWVSCQLHLTPRIKVFGTGHFSSQNSFSRIWTILPLQKNTRKYVYNFPC